MAGTTFGRYKLVRLLARGGMAEVYLALLSGVAGFEKRIALKKILPIYTDLEEFNRLFQDEARISVSLNHSNIVQVFDFGVHHSEYYLAMEYVDGPDLEKILMGARKLGRQLSIDAVVHIAMRIASALEYAHSRVDQQGRSLDLVHRDVSPPNVLLSVQGEVKLTDFGVARYAQRISQSRPGVVRGKYAYMSPEQLTGDVLDSRSDLFSMGVLLLEMLTNVNPFLGESDYKTMEKVVACRPGSVTDYRSGVPRDLVRIVERCLRLHPGTRYQTAGQIRRDLAELMFARGVIDDPQLIVDELWSLFPSQLSRRGLSVPRPREEDAGAISVGMPRMRAGKGVTAGEGDDDWVGKPQGGTAQLGPEFDDDHDPEDDLTIPHIVGNPDAIPTESLDGRSHTLDVPPLAPASQATLREEQRNPFEVKGLQRRTERIADPGPPVVPRGTPGIQAALASPVEIDEGLQIVPSMGGTDEAPAIAEPVDVVSVPAPPAAPASPPVTAGAPDPEPAPAVAAPRVDVAFAGGDPTASKPKRRKTAPGSRRGGTSPGARGKGGTSPGTRTKGSTSPAAKAPRTTTPNAAAAREEEEFPLYGYILVAIMVLALFWFGVNALFGPRDDDRAEPSVGAARDPAPRAPRAAPGATEVVRPADSTDEPAEAITPLAPRAPEVAAPVSTEDAPEVGAEPATAAPTPSAERGTPAPTPVAASAPAPREPATAPREPATAPREPATPTARVEEPPSPAPAPAPTSSPAPRAAPTPATTPEPAPAAAAKDPMRRNSTMTITTQPAGAELTIDGKRVGASPFVVDATPGTIVEIVARKDGYLSTTRLARFGDVATTTLVELSAAPAPMDADKVGVTITAEPWAYVAIDGVVTGKSTPLTVQLDPGSHTITIENPLESWTEQRSVVVQAGKPATISFRKP
jgi:serine/threonine protein kinase